MKWSVGGGRRFNRTPVVPGSAGLHRGIVTTGEPEKKTIEQERSERRRGPALQYLESYSALTEALQTLQWNSESQPRKSKRTGRAPDRRCGCCCGSHARSARRASSSGAGHWLPVYRKAKHRPDHVRHTNSGLLLSSSHTEWVRTAADNQNVRA